MIMADFSFNPSELTVHVGERVRLELRNQGSFPHNFMIGELGINSALLYSEQSGQLEFVAERPGTYEFDCLVTEPSSHLEAGMKGTLKIVASP
jgi:uncharacterized cupredoxin-like copper-binding protein